MLSTQGMDVLFRLACLSALVGVAEPPRVAQVPMKTGDIVFQTSTSSRSALIRQVSQSPYSHVGLVEVASDGVFVIEAIQPVSRTRWSVWKARGVGGKVTVKRSALDAATLKRVVAFAKSKLGTPYDARYRWDDGRLYCSELVTKAFATEGLELGLQQQVKSLALTPELTALGPSLGIDLEQTLVTPASIAEDADLEIVSTDFPSS